MKKRLLSMLAFAGIISTATAQLPVGQIAPNFTLTDINGNSHTLYNYLDQGYSVIVDFSATWCGPCWSFHNSHVLRDIYQQHGPAGMPGVNMGTTDDVMVIFIEGDASTTLADLNGTGSNTQGNWVTGTPYPITNAASTSALNNAYQISGFPNVFIICPNRTIKRTYAGYSSSSMTVANMYNEAVGCPAPASDPTDAALLKHFGPTSTCSGSNVSLQTRLQNNGTSPLTSATIVATHNSNTVATYNWTGNLNTYAYQDVTVGTYPLSANSNIVYTVTATSDNNAANNSQTRSYTVGNTQTQYTNITIKITLDRYGSETSWRLKNSAGTIVAQNPNYTNAGSNGAYPQPDINLTLPNDCYTFEIFDSYGDGMCCAYGNGGYQILANGVLMTGMSGGNFTSSETKNFKVDTSLGLESVSLENSVTVYPNPFTDNTNISLELVNNETVNIMVYNQLGQLVYSANKGTLAAGKHTLNIDFGNMDAGIYIANIMIGNTLVSKKITAAK